MLLLTVALLSNTVYSWKYQGHILIARIAHDILQMENPQALQKAQEVLSILKDEPTTDSERDYRFVEAAPYADIIRMRGGSYQADWHFVNYAILDPGTSVNDFPKFKPGAKNIENALPALIDWLNGKDGYNNSFPY